MLEQQYKNPSVAEEHKRWASMIGPLDSYSGKTTIGIYEVLQAHFLLVDFFFRSKIGIGGVGPRDVNLLHSALNRQFVQFGGKPKWKDRIDICATLMFGLIKNHPFHDANKRTAFLTSILHLQKIGRTPTLRDEDYEDFIVNIAKNKLNQDVRYNKSRLSPSDRDISIISRFLKANTRAIDLRSKTITYNQLNTILGKRGYTLKNPKGNRIDVMRLHDSDGITLLDKPKRVAHIGFQAWKGQVSLKDINIVRQATLLDARHGYDSQSFFNGLEGPLQLIQKYKEPLENLAFR